MAVPTSSRVRALRSGRARAYRPRFRRTRRAVSDVVATILILAITVTLFASIFAFVGSFPKPPAQNVNEFQASLKYTSATHKSISGVSIEHLAGPALPALDRVYLETSTSSSNWQFGYSGGIPVYWGLTTNATSSTWSFGQNWTTSFHTPISTPDNITIYVSSTTQLLYSAVIPGLVLNTPPAISSSGTTPTTVSPSTSFVIWASLSGTLTGVTAKVNLAGLPGLTGNFSMTKGTGGLYSYKVTSGVSTSGTWYAVIYVNNTLGQITSASVPVVISGTSGGSGTSGLSVIVGMSQQPPTLPLADTAYFWGTVTYTGTATGKVFVNFTVLQTTNQDGHTKHVKTTIPGITGQSLAAPGSATVFSQSAYNFNSWLSNSTVTVYGNGTLTGVGTAVGTTSFSVANPGIAGIVYFTTSTTNPTGSKTTSFSHSCTTSSCPYLFATFWDNYTGTGIPTTLSFKGTVTTNSTTGGYTHTYTIASITVTEGTALNLNVVTDSTTGTTRWTVPGGTTHTVYVVRMWLQVYSGTTLVGYLFDNYQATLS